MVCTHVPVIPVLNHNRGCFVIADDQQSASAVRCHRLQRLQQPPEQRESGESFFCSKNQQKKVLIPEWHPTTDTRMRKDLATLWQPIRRTQFPTVDAGSTGAPRLM